MSQPELASGAVRPGRIELASQFIHRLRFDLATPDRLDLSVKPRHILKFRQMLFEEART